MYMKTGRGPEEPMDLVAPKSGGVMPDGKTPERLSPIGYSKDLYTFLTRGPSEWLGGKLNAFASLGKKGITGEDWRGDPIAPNRDPGESLLSYTPKWAIEVLKEIGKAYVPMPVEKEGRKGPGSHLGTFETYMGASPAGMKYSNPDLLQKMQGATATLKQVEKTIHSISPGDGPEKIEDIIKEARRIARQLPPSMSGRGKSKEQMWAASIIKGAEYKLVSRLSIAVK
jgi:hypothetical protein